MKNKSKSKKLIAIMVLPVFLATSFEPLWAAELMMGANGQVQSVISPDQVPTGDALPAEQAPEDSFEAEGALSAPNAEPAALQVGEFQAGGCSQPTYSTSDSSTSCLGVIQTAAGLREIHKYNSRGNTGITIYNLENGESQSFDLPAHGNIGASSFTSGGKYLALEHSFNQVSVVSLHDLKLTGTASVPEWSGAEPHGVPTVDHIESVGGDQFLIRTNDSAVPSSVVLQRNFNMTISPNGSLDLKFVSSNVSVSSGSDVRIDNDLPYASQLVYHWYSNNWTLYVYDIRGGANNAKLIHSRFIQTGQAGGSSALTHLDVVQNANGQDVLNLSIDSTQIDANLSINLTLLQIVVPAGVTIPGTLVNLLEDDRVAAYIYLDAKGKRQAVIYDKVTKKVISQTQRVSVSANEQVIFFDAPKVDNPPGRGYILHLDGATQKLTRSNMNASQIYLTPNEGKIIFITVAPNGNSSFGIYQLGSKTLYMDSIHHWGLGAKLIWTDPNHQYAAVSVGNDERLLIISLSTADRHAFVPATSIYNRGYEVVAIPGFVKGRIATVDFNLNTQTIRAVTTGGDHLLFNMTANGGAWLRQVESWQRSGNVVREYTKIIFGADGKRNNMWLKQYDAKGRIIFEQEVIYDANGKAKRVIAYRYTMIRGRIVKVAV